MAKHLTERQKTVIQKDRQKDRQSERKKEREEKNTNG